jgi:hypothetical protein
VLEADDVLELDEVLELDDVLLELEVLELDEVLELEDVLELDDMLPVLEEALPEELLELDAAQLHAEYDAPSEAHTWKPVQAPGPTHPLESPGTHAVLLEEQSVEPAAKSAMIAAAGNQPLPRRAWAPLPYAMIALRVARGQIAVGHGPTYFARGRSAKFASRCSSA